MQAVVTESLAGLRSRESDEVRVVVNCNGSPTVSRPNRTEKFAVARCPFATLSTVQTTFPVFGKHDPLPLALRPPGNVVMIFALRSTPGQPLATFTARSKRPLSRPGVGVTLTETTASALASTVSVGPSTRPVA